MSPTNAEHARPRRGLLNRKGAQQPGPEALQAMAEASRRSREHDADGVPPPVTPSSSPEPARVVARATLHTDGSDGPPRQVPEQRQSVQSVEPAGPGRSRYAIVTDVARHRSVVLVGALVVALGLSLIIAYAVGGSASSSHNATHPHRGTALGTTAHRRTTPPSTAAPPSTSAPPSTTVPPGAPAISSLAPDAGGAGQVVTVTGSNLFSPNGQVQAVVGGEGAGTRCSTQTTCEITLPALGAPRTVSVTITTQAGSSNPVAFSYT